MPKVPTAPVTSTSATTQPQNHTKPNPPHNPPRNHSWT
jgi:hypothetical protein